MKIILTSHEFQLKHHEFLQKLWLEVLYIEHAKKKGKENLNSVERLRIRRKNNFPMTIWDGEERSYNIKVSDKKIISINCFTFFKVFNSSLFYGL